MLSLRCTAPLPIKWAHHIQCPRKAQTPETLNYSWGSVQALGPFLDMDKPFHLQLDICPSGSVECDEACEVAMRSLFETVLCKDLWSIETEAKDTDKPTSITTHGTQGDACSCLSNTAQQAAGLAFCLWNVFNAVRCRGSQSLELTFTTLIQALHPQIGSHGRPQDGPPGTTATPQSTQQTLTGPPRHTPRDCSPSMVAVPIAAPRQGPRNSGGSPPLAQALALAPACPWMETGT